MIISCFIILYGVLALLFYGILKAADSNIDVILTVFGVIGVVFICCLAIFVAHGMIVNDKVRMSEKWKALGIDTKIN